VREVVVGEDAVAVMLLQVARAVDEHLRLAVEVDVREDLELRRAGARRRVEPDDPSRTRPGALERAAHALVHSWPERAEVVAVEAQDLTVERLVPRAGIEEPDVQVPLGEQACMQPEGKVEGDGALAAFVGQKVDAGHGVIAA
jgi:hypothetical protein